MLLSRSVHVRCHMRVSGVGPRTGDPSSDVDGDSVDVDGELFRRIYPGLYRLASVVCPPEADPDDLVQDATARVLHRHALVALDNPAAYLGRAVVNLASNERRRLGRRRAALHRLSAASASTEPSYPSDLALLLELSPSDRAAVWLADVDRRSFSEIAQILGCSEQAARARASRARRRLRVLIEQEEES